MSSPGDLSAVDWHGCQPPNHLDLALSTSSSSGSFDTQTAWSSSTPNLLFPSAERNSRVKLWCDRVANRFNLKPEQYSDLHACVDLGENLEIGDLRIRIIQLGMAFQTLNAVEAQNVERVKITELLEDVSVRLGKAFTLSKEQNDHLIINAKNLIFDPDRTSYMTLHLELEQFVRSKADILGFTNIFNNPVREKILMAECKEKASNARTQFRRQLIESVDTKRASLEKATHNLAGKFKIGGAGGAAAPDYQLHIALLRRFILDNEDAKVLSETLEAEEPDNGSAHSSDIEEDSAEPAAKKRKVSAAVGKVPKGKDFWSRVDKFLSKLMAQYGASMKTPEWKSYLSQTVIADISRFGTSGGRLLPTLPTTYTQAPSTSTLQSLSSRGDQAALVNSDLANSNPLAGPL